LCGVAAQARGSTRVSGGGTPRVCASPNRRSVRNPANALVGGSLAGGGGSWVVGWSS
jgi:hypothetical protein